MGVFPPSENKYICICDSSKYWVSECIFFSLKNCEYGMDFLRLIGCSEKWFRYMCLSVGLVYNLVYNFDCSIYIVKSRKKFLVSEISLVNLIVGWTVFKCSMNFVSEFIP